LAVAMIAIGGIASAQMMTSEVTVFTAELSGDSVVPSVSTMASGWAVAVLHGTTLVVGGQYADLGSDLATDVRGGGHIHQAAAGETGRIVVELAPVGARSGNFSGVFELTAEQVQALQDGLFYVQVHTADHKPGELRGHLMPVGESM
jgi:hypothetical protein